MSLKFTGVSQNVWWFLETSGNHWILRTMSDHTRKSANVRQKCMVLLAKCWNHWQSLIKFVKVEKVHRRLQNRMKLVKLDKAYQCLQSLSECYLEWSANMCIIPQQIMMILRNWPRSSWCKPRSTFKMWTIPKEIITVFIKTIRGRKNPSINQILKIEISMVTKTMTIFITEIIEIDTKNLITSLMEL